MRDLDQFRCPDRRGRKISRGDLVLIHDDNAKRLWWRHGIVDTLHMGPDGKSSTGPSSASIRWSFTFQMNPSQRDTSSPSESVTAMTPATAAEVESTNVSRFESTVLSNADPTWDCVGNNGQTRRGRQIRLPAKFQTVLNLYGNVVVVDV